MSLGVVKWVDASKGHGFVAPDEGGNDLFVHLSDISGGSKLFVGATVEFERRDGMHGRIVATNVSVSAPVADEPEHVREASGQRASR
jgi:cold shock protein